MNAKFRAVMLGLALLAPRLLAEATAGPLHLSDGRVLSEWSIISESATSVFVKYKGGGAKIPKRLLPAELRAKYPVDEAGAKTEAAALDAAQRAGELRKAEVEAQQRKDREERAAKATARQQAVTSAVEAVRTDVAVKQAVAAEPHVVAAPPSQRILAAATREATRYFKTQHRNGSGSTLVFDLSIDLDGTREIPGWPGRYEVTGVCSYQYYDSVWGGSFRGVTKYFSVQVEAVGGREKITDFTLRSSPTM